MADFERKVQVQVQDNFPAKSDLVEVDEDIREQKVPGELIISYPGNGGRSAVVFKGKPVTHAGEIEDEKIIPQIPLDRESEK
jgi:hypothetical protein